MVGRDVQRLEVVEVVLDLGTLVDLEPELAEDPGDLRHGLDRGVQRAPADGPTGHRDVDGLGGETRIELGGAQDRASLADRGLDALADGVRDGAQLRAVIRRQRADAPQHSGEPALLAEHLELDRLERSDVRRARDGGGRLVGERLQVLCELGEVQGFSDGRDSIGARK